MFSFPGTRYAALLTAFLCCSTSPVDAEQTVEVHVASDAETGLDIIEATSEFRQHGRSLQKVLRSVGDYAGLHPWITCTRLIRENGTGEAEFRIEFSFPWPVGRRWSHILVQHDNNGAISWQQLDGTIKANEGHLRFTSHDDQGITVEYSAIINLGLPEILLRGFKKKFVVDFIKAAYARAANQSLTELALATPADQSTRQAFSILFDGDSDLP